MFTTCSVATNNVSLLDDEPNDIGGLSAAQLKAAYDKFGTDFVAWFNETHLMEINYEEGSNENGTYVRFANGTQICSLNKAVTGLAVTEPVGSIFRSPGQSWTYPAAFVSTPAVTASAGGSSLNGWATVSATPGLSSYGYRVYSPVSATTNINVSLIAVGRWK